MDAETRCRLVAGRGLVGNADQGRRRQVTIIEQEAWAELMHELNATVLPAARRANLLVRGISLAQTRDQILRMGTCLIRVGGETRPCERMEEALPGLRSAMRLSWRGGVFAEVLDDGEISVGDHVAWIR
jgi:MOSC domain-containing protein YiiM